MANRVTLNSANTVVIIGESPSFKTTNESGFVFAGVRSASYGFSNVRADVNQIGGQLFEQENIIRHPDVTLEMTYGFTPTFANEEILGLNYNLDAKPENSILNGLSEVSNNFYFYNHPEQGFDGMEYIKNGAAFPNGGEVVSIGNAFLTNYSINFGVGDFPTVDVSFDCSNIKIENYFSQTIETPAINLKSGNNIGVGAIDLSNINYSEPRKFGDIYDLDRTNIETILPYDILIEMKSLSIGGQRMDFETHRINQFSVNLPIERSNLYRLGSDYVCDREVKYPINGSLSISSLVSQMEAGFISGLVSGDEISNLRIITSDCRKQITSQFYFEDIKLEKIQYETLVNEQTNYNLEFSFQVSDEKGFKTSITEQDIGPTRFIDENNVVYEYILDDVIANWQSGDLNGYKVAFGELRDYNVFDGAFAYATNIDKPVYLPEQILTMGDDVFIGCANLPSFYFDSSCVIPSFGERCFKDCSSLENIFLPESVKNVKQECFMGCDSAEAVFLADVVTIGDRAFYNCSGLNQSLYLPDSLVNLGESSFENCTGLLGGLYIGESLKEIKQKAFKNCNNLSFDLTIPNNVSGIGQEAFYECGGFNGELTLSDQLATIEDYTFYNCSSLKGNLSIPESVNEIKIGAFQGCSSFDGSILAPNVDIFGDASFSGCNNLQGKLTLNSGIQSVGDNAFMNCSSLGSSLNIPSGINSIGDGAFSGCVGITDVFLNAPPTIFQGDNAFAGIQGCMYVSPFYYNDYLALADAGIFQGMPVCYGSLDTIVYDANTSEVLQFRRGDIPTNWYANKSTESFLVIGSTCKNIESGAFSGSYGITGFFVLPEEVESIGDFAFYGCHFDGDLIIPDSVKSLGVGAFENCSGFDDLLEIGDGIEIIKEKTFKNCTNIHGDIIVGSNVTLIEDEAFYNCTGVSGDLFIGGNISYIGDYAFYNCNNAIGDLDLPPIVNYIGDYAFYNCSSLGGEFGLANVGECEYIGNYAFEECSLMTGPLLLPENLGYLGSGAFKNCRNLNSTIDLGAAEFDYILEETFFGCSGLIGELVIPDSILGIGDRAFLGCDGLTLSITITNIAAKNIGVDVFNDPLPFAELIISDSVQTIVQGDFDYFKTDPIYLTMQEGLQVISGYSFSNYAFIGSLELPFSLNYIGEAAFSGCGFAGTYEFASSNVSYIGAYAFYDLNLIDGPLDLGNVDFIGDGAFYNNSSVDGFLTLNSEVGEVGEYTFYNCSNMLGSLNFSSFTSGIGQYAFANCSSLSGTIYLPNNEFYTTVKTGTFLNCQGLSGDLIVHDYITSIEQNAFLGCVGLDGDITITDVTASTLVGSNSFDDSPFERLIISDSVVNIDNGEFDYFASRSMEVVFQEGLSGILDNAFDNYNFVGELIFPDSLTGIGVSAFQNCDGFSGNLIINDFVSGIGVDAFRSCDNLSGNLIIPSDLVNLGDGAFVDCVKLDGYLKISDLTAQSISSYLNVFNGTNFYELRAASSDFLIEDTEFDTFEFWVGDLYLADSAVSLGSEAFVENYSFANKLTINENSDTIGDYAFSGNSFTGDLYIPSLNVGYASFAECTSFDGEFSIDFFQNVTIGSYAFYNCSNLSGNLIIPETTTTIGVRSFGNMTSLNGEFFLCQLPDDFDGKLSEYLFDDEGELEGFEEYVTTSLNSFDDYAFAGNSNLSGNLVIPDTTTSWGDYAFLDMNSLGGFLILGSGVNTIPRGIFKNCSNLKCYDDGIFRIPENVTTIEQEAFYNCSSLNCDLRLKPGVSIGTNAFFNTNFSNILVPSGTVSIVNGDYDAFQSFTLGLKFEQPDTSFTTIGDNAFDDYKLVGNLSLPSSMNNLGSAAFQNNSGLVGDLIIPNGISFIEDYTFENCGFDGELDYSNNVNIIGTRAFSNCKDLKGEVYIPLGVTEIRSGAFAGCTSISGTLNLERNGLKGGGSAGIYSHAFSGCSAISGVFIETVPPSAFKGEQALSGITDYFYLGPLVETLYREDIENNPKPGNEIINDVYYYQGMPISGVGDPNTYYYSGILGSNQQDASLYKQINIDVIGLNEYAIPEDWVNATNFGCGVNEDQQCEAFESGIHNNSSWLELGAVVTSIFDRAFKNNDNLGGVVDIPLSCQRIGEEAFANSQDADFELQGGDGLVEIKKDAFVGCEKIKGNFVFGPVLEVIREGAFKDCKSLDSVEFIGGTLSGIENNAFENLFAISNGQGALTKEVDFDIGLKSIGDSAFKGSHLTYIEFNSDLSGIGSQAFYGCDKINQPIFLPGSLITIGTAAFKNASLRENINIPSLIDEIPDECFYNNPNFWGFTSWGDITRVGDFSFYNCNELRGVDVNGQYSLLVPENVYIGDSAFQNCGISLSSDTLEKVGLPLEWDETDGGINIFKGCSYVSGLEIDKALYIQNGMFEGCSRVFLQSGDFSGSLSGIGDFAFKSTHNNINAKGFVYIPNSVIELGQSAFEGCPHVSGLGFESAFVLETIKQKTFKDIGSADSLLNDVIIPNSVTTVGSESFMGLYALDNDIYIPSSIESTENSAFRGMRVRDLYWSGSENQPTYGTSVFEDVKCRDLIDVATIEAIPDGFFRNIEVSGSNNSYQFYSGTREISTEAFKGAGLQLDFSQVINPIDLYNYNGTPDKSRNFLQCEHSGSLTITPGLKSMGHYFCFSQMDNLNFITIEQSSFAYPVEISAFRGCSNLSGFSLPDNITEIKSDAFRDCTSLSGFDISSSDITRIGQNAFRGCTNLSGVDICNGNLTRIDSYAFADCPNLDQIEICSSVNNFGSENDAPADPESKYIFSNSIANQIDFNASVNRIPKHTFQDSVVSNLNFATSTLRKVRGFAFYRADIGPQPYSNLPDEITEFENGAFFEFKSSGVNIPSGLIGIGNDCFKNSTILTGLDFSAATTFTGMDSRNFEGCTSLKEVKFPASMTGMENDNFSSFTNACGVSGVDFSTTSLKGINNSNFRSCASLKQVLWPSTMESMGTYNFTNAKLDDLILPPNLVSMGDNNYLNCEKLGGGTWSSILTIPSTVTSIGNDNWRTCDAVLKVEFPAAFAGTVGNGNFKSCGFLNELTVDSSGNASFGNNNFQGDTTLDIINIGSGASASIWAGTNNFQGISSSAKFYVHSSVISEYDGTWSGQQGLPQGCTIQLPLP